uniref:Uncharacterized protein n=1 Tax=Setaria digitata TaxID=48799 RepID=A0A915PFZ9_9BILA
MCSAGVSCREGQGEANAERAYVICAKIRSGYRDRRECISATWPLFEWRLEGAALTARRHCF